MAKDWQHKLGTMEKCLVENIKIKKDIVTGLTQEINSLSKHLKKYTQQASFDRIEERLNELKGIRIKEVRRHQQLCKNLKPYDKHLGV